MLNRSYFLVVVLLLFSLFFGGYFYKKEEIPEIKSDISKGAWIEIQSGTAFVLDKDSNKKELFTGHTINEGDEIEVSGDGKVSVHLFDGSVLRADAGTRFSIKNALYDKSSGRLALEAFLFKGRIWSKIIELTTPDSLWKIETSNTVATVRGSAFGVSTDGIVSEIIGSQHRVFVDLLDPETKNKINKESIIIEEDSLLKIDNKDIKELEKITADMPSQTASSTALISQKIEEKFRPKKKDELLKRDNWLNENETEDSVIEEGVRTIKNELKDKNGEWKKSLNIKTEAKFNEAKNKKESGARNKNKEEKDNNIKKPDNRPAGLENNKIKEEIKETVIIPSTKPLENWNELRIETLTDLKNIIEGEMIGFRAVLRGENGLQKDITRESDWRVLGPVGIISRPGTFAAKLDPSISEMGEGFGFVVAVWKDQNGKEFLGKSDEIHVNMKIDEIPLSEEIMMGQ